LEGLALVQLLILQLLAFKEAPDANGDKPKPRT
jgi:hypothetical protein